MGEELIDTLVALHALDPAAVGLGDFGKPQGFIERQVRRFSEQLDDGRRRARCRSWRSCDAACARAIPPESRRRDRPRRLPPRQLHRHATTAHIAAVLDWEMATLGDPLADLGILRHVLARPRTPTRASPRTVGNAGVITLPGFPTWQEAVDALRREERPRRRATSTSTSCSRTSSSP